MKLYKIAEAAAGQRWHASKTGLKDPVDLELPKDGRGGMAAFLNENEREVGLHRIIPQALDELEQAEMRAVQASTTAPYQSPLDARTVIAGIDAGMCAQAIAQMEGPNLAKVVHAAILRMAQLGKGLNAMGDTGDGG